MHFTTDGLVPMQAGWMVEFARFTEFTPTGFHVEFARVASGTVGEYLRRHEGLVAERVWLGGDRRRRRKRRERAIDGGEVFHERRFVCRRRSGDEKCSDV